MKSIWEEDIIIEKRESLKEGLPKEKRKADVVIVGAGMAGLLTAYFLKRHGIRTIVLEADRIASGQTKRTTAKITSQHGLIYHKLIKNFGKEKAAMYANANQEAIQAYKEIIKNENISCYLEEKNSYLYSTKEWEDLKKEAEAVKELGIPSEYTTKTKLPIPVTGAVCFFGQAQFHPLIFLDAISKNLEIYENTKVLSIEEKQVVTEYGTIEAENIVVATHYPFINAPGYYFMRMHQSRSYVLALEYAEDPDGMYKDKDQGGFSFRSYGNYVLLGGSGHRTGENEEGGCYERLRQKAKQLYPESVERYHWSAQDCMPIDEVPYIGYYSSSLSNLYVATGFQKWGMTSSMVSARILCDMVTGKKNEYEPMFSPQRFNLTASGKNLVKDMTETVVRLGSQFLKPPEEKLKEIEKGKAGIIEYEGEKIGVYREENGTPHFVSTKCPHLGCQLKFNPDELSWDCPCHGSRFDYDGMLLNNPATKNLDHPKNR